MYIFCLEVDWPINGAAYKWGGGDYNRKFTVYKVQLRLTNEAGSYSKNTLENDMIILGQI